MFIGFDPVDLWQPEYRFYLYDNFLLYRYLPFAGIFIDTENCFGWRAMPTKQPIILLAI